MVPSALASSSGQYSLPYSTFERIGRRVYRGLDDELRGIVAEKGLEDGDLVEQLLLLRQHPERPSLGSPSGLGLVHRLGNRRGNRIDPRGGRRHGDGVPGLAR